MQATTLPAGTFPRIARLAPHLGQSDRDAGFEFGLGLILTGLHAELERRALRPGGDLSPQDMGDCKP